MKKSHFPEEQIAHALRQTRATVAELSCKTGITEQTFYRWKKRFGCNRRLRPIRLLLRYVRR